MPRLLSILVVLGLCCGATNWIVAQSGVGAGTSRAPLDMPSGGKGGGGTDGNAVESITFYTTEYEGDAFFWCLDKSCSMGGAKMQVLMGEMCHAILELSHRTEFTMVAFSTNYIVWREQAAQGTSESRAAAMAWVQALHCDGMTCLLEAAVKTVEISNNCTKRKKQIILLSDGLPNCGATPEECIDAITGANYQGTPINTVYISNETQGQNFMRTLAAANNGTFTQVD